MENEYVRSLVNTISYLSEVGITYKFLNEYSSQVNMAREATAMGSMFLDAFNTELVRGEVTYDKIIWIDSDISWEINDFMKVYESDKDIISGIYLNDLGVPMFSLLSEEVDMATMISSSLPFPVSATGFGFIAIKSGIFEKIQRPWFDLVFNKLVNDNGKEMLIPFGEDYSWCHKARNVGFDIYIDPSVKLNHHKKVTINAKEVLRKTNDQATL